MAKCPGCAQTIPDDAVHCGFCGASLRTSPPAGPLLDKKTRFGYAAMGTEPDPAKPDPAKPDAMAELAKPDPVGTEPVPIAGPPTEPDSMAGSDPMALTDPLAPDSAGAPPGGVEPMDSLLQTRTDPGPPPSFDTAPTERADPMGFQTQQDPQAEMSQSGRQLSLNTPIPGHEKPDEQPHEPQPHESQPHKPQEPVAPAQTAEPQPAQEPAQKPAVTSDSSPKASVVEPGKTRCRVLMLVGGIMLVGIFVAPWSYTSAGLVFSWDLLTSLNGLEFSYQIYLAAGGIIFITSALLPLPYILRGIVGVTLGLAPLVLFALTVETWQLYVTIATLVVLPAALFHRRRFRRSILARVFIAIGLIALLSTLLIPVNEKIPLLQLFVGLAQLEPDQLPLRLMPLVLVVLALLSLLGFLGKNRTGFTHIWGVGLLLYLPLSLFLQGLFTVASFEEALAQPAPFYQALSVLIFLIFSAMGLSHIFAKANRSPTP